MLNKSVCTNCIGLIDKPFETGWGEGDEINWRNKEICCPVRYRVSKDIRYSILKIPSGCPHKFEHSVAACVNIDKRIEHEQGQA